MCNDLNVFINDKDPLFALDLKQGETAWCCRLIELPAFTLLEYHAVDRINETLFSKCLCPNQSGSKDVCSDELSWKPEQHLTHPAHLDIA